MAHNGSNFEQRHTGELELRIRGVPLFTGDVPEGRIRTPAHGLNVRRTDYTEKGRCFRRFDRFILGPSENIMQKNTTLLFASVFFTALLPSTVWGYDAVGGYGYDRYYPGPGFERVHRHSGRLRLHTDMTGEGYYVRADIQGLGPDDVQVNLRRGRLILQISQRDRYGVARPNARGAYQWKRRLRSQLRLPYDADVARMTTNISDGVLEIFIPRRSRNLPENPSD